MESCNKKNVANIEANNLHKDYESLEKKIAFLEKLIEEEKDPLIKTGADLKEILIENCLKDLLILNDLKIERKFFIPFVGFFKHYINDFKKDFIRITDFLVIKVYNNVFSFFLIFFLVFLILSVALNFFIVFDVFIFRKIATRIIIKEKAKELCLTRCTLKTLFLNRLNAQREEFLQVAKQ